MPLAVQAGLWGLLSGSALILGALLGYFARISTRWIAGIMAFGSGVLISALSFELMDEAFKRGGFTATAAGFIGGAAVYTAANIVVSHHGARHRKRSGNQQAEGGSGLAIAIGALLDGIPESVAIGVTMLAGGSVSMVAVIAIFLSNVPEGLSSAAGMHHAGRSVIYVFGLWSGIAILSGMASWLGYIIFSQFNGPGSSGVIAATEAVAAGAILAMIADTMIPEAFEQAHDYAGFITVSGFLAAFALSKLGG